MSYFYEIRSTSDTVLKRNGGYPDREAGSSARTPLKWGGRMEIFARRCGIHNTDVRYYRDKYLGLLFVFSTLSAFAVFADWPLPHSELAHGAKLVTLSLVCIALSRYRVVLVGALFAFITVRLVWVAVIFHWWEGWVLGLSTGAISLLVVLGRLWFKGDYSLPYTFGSYSAGEFSLDIVAFLLMLALLRVLAL